jgi:Holliday junction resolvase
MLLGAGFRRPVANFRHPASGLNAPNLVAVHGDAALAIEVNDYIYYIAHIYALEVE